MTSCYLFQFNTENLSMQINLDEDQNINLSILGYMNNNYIADSDSIFFENIWNNTDLKYQFLENSIKEYIYLKSHDSPKEFKFKLECNGTPTINNGDLLFINNNDELIYSIEKPFIIKDNKKYDYDGIINHTFDPESNIYTVKLGNVANELFPLIIDPNFNFPSSKYAKGEVYSGISKAKSIIVGSDPDGQPLEFSNKIIYTDKPNEILGSDLVTFNKEVNVFLDLFKKDNTKNLNINSITVAGINNFKNLFDIQTSSITENIEVQLSAILLYIDRSKKNEDYSVYFSFNQIPPDFISITNKISLVKEARSTESLGDEYGVLSGASSNNLKFNFSYTAPENMDNLDYALIKIENIIEHNLKGKTITTTKTNFIYLQFTNNISTIDFDFRNNSAKTDFINSDLYLPSHNRGLVIIDSSLGIVRILDEDSGLPSNALNVYCANRIGTIDDPRGLLLCTEDGIYYFCNKPIGDASSVNKNDRPDFTLDPYKEPTIYGKPIKVSNLEIIDFVMSDIFLFLLTKDNKILNFTYKTFLYNLINKPLNINSSNNINKTLNIIDLSEINDRYILENDDKINLFSNSNFFDKENNIQYNSPYMPKIDGGPLKLLPICVNSDNRFLSDRDSIMESAYFTNEQKKLYGITVLYNQNEVVE